MATSDEPPPAGLAAGLSRGPWSPPTFDVVRRSPPFWGGTPAPAAAPAPPPSSNFLDLNAPFEEDPQPASRPDLGGRGLPNFVDQLGSGPSGGPVEVSFLHPAKGNDGDGLRSFLDATGTARNNHDADGASGARDQDPGLDTGPFVDYLSQFSGKKEADAHEAEPPKPETERTDFPDELLSLSSLYHKKRGGGGGGGGGDSGGRQLADGAALFLASGKGQEVPGAGLRQAEQQIRHAKESRAGLLGNFGSNRLDDLEHFREVEKVSHVVEGQQAGLSIEERSLFPRNAVNSDSFFQMPNIVREERMSNMVREERVLLPMNVSARETLDLSNNLAFKEEKAAMSRHGRAAVESSKEGMSLSLKRSYEDMDAAEEYNRRREEEVVQAALYGRQPEGRDVEENSDVSEVSHLKRRRERAGGEEQRFQHDLKRVQNDQSAAAAAAAADDKSIVWPPVVIIENTRLGWDDERKQWKGLGHDDIRKSLKNVENLEYAKVKCLFDMNGQKSSALVIFPNTFEGYFEAEALNDQLERSGKGRDQWMRVRPQDLYPRTMRGWNTPDLVSPDGKRILYGYLAMPEDIQRADPHKSSLKWFVESFNEKVRKPAQQRHQMQ
ncbi:hypothetical protein MPTK1_7g14250 [Marchantia polymorpha subsp. ruderalis]|uniref:XS domain-containing protein n=1 Tax=Marchantia polymorpha subsp. ruderalis TaxID=1480154 RepID=A0AAF6BZH0_MARPO|nr:hypothetical protein Mp_7g14260 [Marchantia polymorpha subsp. ruderalis]BBN17404.1 hypothetical protein Mp_7g14260 [Marchantia polymorpha subsp. ruderalis]